MILMTPIIQEEATRRIEYQEQTEVLSIYQAMLAA